MASVSQTQSSDRTLSDQEFEDLLLRTWELIHARKQDHPVNPSSADTPSWT